MSETKLPAEGQDKRLIIIRGDPNPDLASGDWLQVEEGNEPDPVADCRRFLSSRIHGQDRAIDAICDSYERYVNDDLPEDEPLDSFLFLGPSGAGKTELVRCFAEFLFGSREALKKLDGSMFQHEADINLIRGAAAGYIRADEIPPLSQPGLEEPVRKIWPSEVEARRFDAEIEQLRAKVKRLEREIKNLEARREDASDEKDYDSFGVRIEEKRNELEELAAKIDGLQKEARKARAKTPEFLPNILLIDELEEAHPSLLGVLLQILDEARFDVSFPGQGIATTRFHRTWIFMTSNIGMREIAQRLSGRGRIGFASLSAKADDSGEAKSQEIYEAAMGAVKTKLPVKFRNRIVHVIVFRPFTRDILRQICVDNVDAVRQEVLIKFLFVLEVSDDVLEFLVDEALEHPEEGARLLKKKVRSRMRRPLMKMGFRDQLLFADVVFVGIVTESGKRNLRFFFNTKNREVMKAALEDAKKEKIQINLSLNAGGDAESAAGQE